MTHARSLLAWGAAVASATVLATLAVSASAQEGAVSAAKAAAPAAGPQIAPPSSAVQALNRGIEAYRKNKLATAIGALSSAVSLGGLDSAGTAKALYYRGLAYRKQGRSAQAISDLTNALWLKNGLGETERAEAIANRTAAYKEAGIADPDAQALAPSASPAAPAPAPVAFATPATTSTVSAAATKPPQRVARAPAEGAEAPPTATESAPATERATERATQQAAPAPTPAASSGLGAFFSNLFGGSSSQPASVGSAGGSDVTTASTGVASGGATTAASSWNSSAEVTARQTARRAPATAARARTAALASARRASDAAPSAPAGDGRFKLQIAAVRSRAEAEAVARRFSSEQGDKAGGRNPAIDEAVFGNMGKFYRVNVGPFASAAEPEKLCKTLRASGYDCLIIGK